MAKKSVRTKTGIKAKRSGTKASGGGRKRSGRDGYRVAAIAAVITAAVGIALIVWYGSRLFAPVVPPGTVDKEVKVYVADEAGLHLEGRAHRVKAASIEEGIRISIELILKDESRTVPEGTRLKGVEIKGKTAFIDLSGDATERHKGGSSGEIMTVYSIVNTVTLNFPEIDKVQILINGRKEKTLAGHIDIGYPIPPEKKFIKG
jgi:hypothetical protein